MRDPDIAFDVIGNPDDPRGNPLPKLRMTRGQSWKPEVQRYMRWKRHVQNAYVEALTPFLTQIADRNIVEHNKPIDIPKGQAPHMELLISFADEKHPDPENVFGSVADALFANDKHLSGRFVFDHSPIKRGSVRVRIWYDSPIA